MQEKIYSFFIKIALLPFKIYRLIISPFYAPTCRFVPSCSEYAIEAVKIHGVFKGGYLTLKRILKCHPFSKKSGLDEVPKD